jgi:hypothetical protein
MTYDEYSFFRLVAYLDVQLFRFVSMGNVTADFVAEGKGYGYLRFQ